jgi:hypothetical protein
VDVAGPQSAFGALLWFSNGERYGLDLFQYSCLSVTNLSCTSQNSFLGLNGFCVELFCRVGLAAGVGADFPDSCKDWLARAGIDTSGLVLWPSSTLRTWQFRCVQ